MKFKNHKPEFLVGFMLLLIVIITIVYGEILAANGITIRRWYWNNLLFMLPLLPFILLQHYVSLPAITVVTKKQHVWWSAFGVGILFGLLDVLVIKLILHPQPYQQLPPFLQPFPYSILLFTSGALEVELYYRMIPLTIVLLLDIIIFQLKHRKQILIVLAVITSIIEPIQQFPDGAIWFIVYATLSGIAMNLWQFKCYVNNGFLASLLVRLGHYLIWHILLGLYVEFIELG